MPDGETCTLDGAQVKGNVKVGIGSTLMTADAMIKGNVFGQQAMRVHIIDTDVWGQIHFRRTAKEIIIGNDGCKVVPNAGGNINLQNNYGPIGICQMTIKNNIILHNNHNRIGVFDNRVGNNIEVMSNTSAAIRLRDNTMKGGLLIKGNTVAKVLNVSTNSIGGNANCTMNVVAPTGSGNTAGGALSGQARAWADLQKVRGGIRQSGRMPPPHLRRSGARQRASSPAMKASSRRRPSVSSRCSGGDFIR